MKHAAKPLTVSYSYNGNVLAYRVTAAVRTTTRMINCKFHGQSTSQSTFQIFPAFIGSSVLYWLTKRAVSFRRDVIVSRVAVLTSFAHDEPKLASAPVKHERRHIHIVAGCHRDVFPVDSRGVKGMFTPPSARQPRCEGMERMFTPRQPSWKKCSHLASRAGKMFTPRREATIRVTCRTAASATPNAG